MSRSRSLTHYAESLRAKDFGNNGRRILARLVRLCNGGAATRALTTLRQVRVLCELASDPRASPGTRAPSSATRR